MALLGLQELAVELTTAGRLLRDQLRVPPFQRRYAWTTEEVGEFFNDVRAALTGGQRVYFIGTIVVARDSSAPGLLIDGQQRLTTTALLISVIREHLQQQGAEARAQAIQERFLVSRSVDTGLPEAQLVLGRVDAEFYSQTVLGESPAPTTDAQQRIQSALKQLRLLLHQDLESFGPHWEKRVSEWLNYIENGVAVIAVSVVNEADAYLVFEALNDRGLPLNIADVVKNYLLSRCDDAEAAEASWDEAEDALRGVGGKNTLPNYLRHWWSSHYGAVREKNLYSAIQTEIRSSSRAEWALDGLVQESEIYALSFGAALLGEHVETRRLAAGTDTLSRLALDQYRPLYLAAFATRRGDELEALLKNIVSVALRGLVAGGLGGGTAERAYAAAARELRRADDGLSAAYSELGQIATEDGHFASSFRFRSIRARRIVKYLLHALLKHADGDRDPSLITDAEHASVSLVRIETRSMLSDEDRQIENRLGNLTLVDAELASDVPKDRQARLSYLEAHSLFDLDMTLQRKNRSAATDDRQDRWADRAPEVWPLDFSDG